MSIPRSNQLRGIARTISNAESRLPYSETSFENSIKILKNPDQEISSSAYISLLQSCAKNKALVQGQKIHAHIIISNSGNDHEPETTFKSDPFLCNALLTMYTKCGRIFEARKVFDEMPAPDICSWTVLIAAYTRHGKPQEAINLFWEMQRLGIRPNDLTFSAVLPACTALGDLELGSEIHRLIRDCGYEGRVSAMTPLLDMYAKCGSIRNARQVFDEMPQRNVVSWNSMIAAYARHGPPEEALWLFDEMKARGVHPTEFTFVAVIPACAEVGCLEKGIEIHQEIHRAGFQRNVILATRLVDMYARCGSLDRAWEVFDQTSQRDTVLWNVMITGYARAGLIEKALDLFRKMPQRASDSWNSMISGFMGNGLIKEAVTFFYEMPKKSIESWNAIISGLTHNHCSREAAEIFRKMIVSGMTPNLRTFSGILPVCTLEQIMQIHRMIIIQGTNLDTSIENVLLDMYGKFGKLKMAETLFNGMKQRNVVTWNTMITFYTRHGHFNEALELYYRMEKAGIVPNQYTYASILASCSKVSSLEHGTLIHEDIFRHGFQSNVVIITALVDMYVQFGNLEKARQLFDQMHSRDTALWNTMISGYMQNGHFQEVMKLFDEMPQRNEISWIVMISGFCQKGLVDHAFEIFEKMPRKSIAAWNAMITGFTQNGKDKEALILFRKMQDEHTGADLTTFCAILSACGALTSMLQGMEIHANVIRDGCQSDLSLTNALIHFYSKCGDIKIARKLFDKMKRRDLISWNTIISGYAMHGYGDVAIELFEEMQASDVKPSDVTLVNVLSACSHAGLVEKGRHYFNSMDKIYHVTATLEHYKCLVDLLGRAGHFDEAENVIKKMPMEPDAALWSCLLGACRTHNNIELAECVIEQIFKMNSPHAGPYVLLSNMYAAAGKWADFEWVRKMMKKRQVRKTPGCSWIEINKEVHVFTSGNAVPSKSISVFNHDKENSISIKQEWEESLDEVCTDPECDSDNNESLLVTNPIQR